MSVIQPTQESTDLLIIGGGPAGMFAAFYGGMRQATVKLIESMPQLGGQLAALYPEKYIYDVAGYPKVTAQELVNNLHQQMQRFNTEICLEEKVIHVEKKDERHFVVTTDRGEHHAKAVIITAGVGAFEPRRLELEDAVKHEGRSLHYFVNDLSRFAGRKVLISGGGDSAVDWALMLEPIAEQVTLIHRRDKFRAHEHSVENLMASSVQVITPTEITALHGEDMIHQVELKDVKSQEITLIDVDDVIINFGFISSLGPIADWGIDIHTNSIVVDSRMETSVPGIFAAGDITTYPGKLKLIAVGFGEAPTAVNNAKVYVDPEAKLSPGHSTNLKM
ncbi:thioredoxin reductase (NADPH) [Paenibacillus shirakamiensis]|uniref:Ferredoxin--NADP reductase n=1 Tax=Paenibacillus shirakamiensis TaxID=1265935 RepID=A0ABS4JK54_9BACL|nr:NAD(P)/FAD-dependent oxidoreductase [Paenibacillus shirakamiensis]MBP2002084.1 thioredoxin reductase (NADPH) [Paenibacillus shirakamiensis]